MSGGRRRFERGRSVDHRIVLVCRRFFVIFVFLRAEYEHAGFALPLCKAPSELLWRVDKWGSGLRLVPADRFALCGRMLVTENLASDAFGRRSGGWQSRGRRGRRASASGRGGGGGLGSQRRSRERERGYRKRDGICFRERVRSGLRQDEASHSPRSFAFCPFLLFCAHLFIIPPPPCLRNVLHALPSRLYSAVPEASSASCNLESMAGCPELSSLSKPTREVERPSKGVMSWEARKGPDSLSRGSRGN